MGALGNEFMRNDHLGYISSCPSNLGTGLQITFCLNIPLLASHESFDDILASLRLEKKMIQNGDDDDANPLIQVSNVDKLGKTEVQLTQESCEAVDKMIAFEKSLGAGEDISDEVKKLQEIQI